MGEMGRGRARRKMGHLGEREIDGVGEEGSGVSEGGTDQRWSQAGDSEWGSSVLGFLCFSLAPKSINVH
ncbi:hypothetical protein Acr_11g0014150 [Actinidia rufa]|uniref:Uncharacterized protein n=1 Tax=Actinidia rufa TaxID=165716 RepID=A0A7J0FFZ1_9ERIC|nr:hypothetical protein Acr_11g0014150 [Actinidia rufa]